MKRHHPGVFYAIRQAVRFCFVGGLLLGLWAFINFALTHMLAGFTICLTGTIILIGGMWFGWGERAVGRIGRRRD